MTIQQILAELPGASKPIARVLHKGEGFKVLAIGFTTGMILAEHKAHVPSRLTVIKGSVMYKSDGQSHILQIYDEFDIPVEELHSVEAIENSICLLIQGK